MKQIVQFIISRSEYTRKIIAGTTVAIAGIMLFFAWGAGVAARLPMLGSELSLSPTNQSMEQEIAATITAQNEISDDPQPNTEQEKTKTASLTKGLMESFGDMAKVFQSQYSAAFDSVSPPASSAPSQPPIDGLFNNIGDETAASSTEISETTSDLPPIEELPGI